MATNRHTREKSGKTPESIYAIFFYDSIVSIVASFLAAMFVRWVSEPIPGFSTIVLIWLLCSLIGSSIGFLSFKTFKTVRRHASVRSTSRMFGAIILKEIILAAALLFGIIKLPTPTCYALILTLDLIFTTSALLFSRLSARLMPDTSNQVLVKAMAKSALVYGTDDQAIQLAAQLESEGFSVAGFITRERKMSGRVIDDHVVYYCPDDKEFDFISRKLGGIDCLFFPSGRQIGEESGPVDDDTPDSNGMSQPGQVFKRVFDILLSALLLAFFSPLIGICALFVKLEDGSPVIYPQERIGRGGKPFNIYKFRTMRNDAEPDGTPALYIGEDDPRLTRVGRFLRLHHLDELPQLWNILRGDMSFVGYRPERKYFIDQIMAQNARYRYLYQIRPGITSYATLYNGYTDTLDKMLTRLDLDLYYLRNQSIDFDAKVLGLTFFSIVLGKKF